MCIRDSGKDAAGFCQGHERFDTPCAWDSPWGRIAQRGGKILMLGVSLARNTFVHGVEAVSYTHLEVYKRQTLILCGDGDKANRPAALRLSERIEKAKLDWIPQAGHEVNRDHPAALSRKLQAFFSQANQL